MSLIRPRIGRGIHRFLQTRRRENERRTLASKRAELKALMQAAAQTDECTLRLGVAISRMDTGFCQH